MLIEFLEKPIMIDGKEFAKDFRININEKKQMRMKIHFYDPKKEGEFIPLDLVVYGFDSPHVEGLGFSFGLNGKELIRNIPFTLKLGFNLPKRKWRLRGCFNNKDLDKSMDNIGEIITYIRDLL